MPARMLQRKLKKLAAEINCVEIWDAPHVPGSISARCTVPGSKSESNRALVLAALANKPSTLTGVLDARDTRLMVAGLKSLGAKVEMSGETVKVYPPMHFSGGEIDCGLAGTVARFLPPVATLASGNTRFFGDPQMCKRPIAPLLDGLSQLGAQVSAHRLPFVVSAPNGLSGRKVVIDSSASSQFISGLLLSAPRFPNGIELTHSANQGLVSIPHIEMTTKMLQDRGVDVSRDNLTWRVAPGSIRALNQRIEPDLTNATVFLAAGLVTGGAVTVAGWPQETIQPADEIRQTLSGFGVETRLSNDGLTAICPTNLHGCELDLSRVSELTPVIAGLAVFAEGTTIIRGIGHIRGHETNRIRAICTELNKLTVKVRELDDGLAITGTDLKHLAPRVFSTYADHRMVHLGALLALRINSLKVADVNAATKTMPDFQSRWERICELS